MEPKVNENSNTEIVIEEIEEFDAEFLMPANSRCQ